MRLLRLLDGVAFSDELGGVFEDELGGVLE